MSYRIVDFRYLATLWFNEFLPQMENKAAFVESAGIIYINNVNLESTRRGTMKFMKTKISEMLAFDTSTYIFAQEPKPINNIHLKPMLRLVETIEGVSQDKLDRILHLANRRCVLESDTVFVSQNKEMDEFMNTVFVDLMKKPPRRTRFYPIQSLGIQDFIDVSRGFFPKTSLKVQDNILGNHIKVRSSNEILSVLSGRIMKGRKLDSETLDYIERTRKSMLDDIEKLV